MTKFITLVLTTLLLISNSLATPLDDTTTSTTLLIGPEPGPEFSAFAAQLDQLMRKLPANLPDPKTPEDFEASRKIIADAMASMRLDVSTAGHQMCDTTGASPRLTDALYAGRLIWDWDRCRMNRRCHTFSSWGEAAVGACAGGFQVWDLSCKSVFTWALWVSYRCVVDFGGVGRTGGRFFFDDPSGSDVRVYHS